MLKMEVNKEKIPNILQFFFDKSKNASQASGIVNAVTANYVKFWLHRFRSGIFHVKDAPPTGRFVVENVNTNTETIEIDQHVSSRSITQELKIENYLRQVGFK
ncbi:histone-lysine N-methyltransferase SETMAR [Trichonephila clavipes]|nr:histone-lysine N-methyltransferase SETMAR [Trichonephila clavipes]